MKKCLFFLLILISAISFSMNYSVKIGVNLELSGPLSSVANEALDAIKMMVDEINANGGIEKGEDLIFIDLSVEDNLNNPGLASTIAKDFKLNGCLAMIGPLISGNSVETARMAEEAGLLTLLPISTSIETTKNKKWVFRACFTSETEGDVVAEFVKYDLGIDSVAVVYEESSEYSEDVAMFITNFYEESGGEVILSESFSTRNDDYSDIYRKIVDSGVKGVILTAFYDKVALHIKQAREAGFEGVFIGTDSWNAVELLQDAGNLLDGSFYAAHFFPDPEWSASRDFTEKYLSKFGFVPGSAGALSYDSIGMIVEAIKNCQTISPESMQNAFKNLFYEGVTGLTEYFDSTTPEKDVFIVGIDEGKEFLYKKAGPW